MEDSRFIETGFGALLTREEEGNKNALIIKLSKINAKTKSGVEIINKGKDEGIIETPSRKEDLNGDNEDWSPSAISSFLDACSHYDKKSIEYNKLDMDCVWKEISEEASSRCKSSKKPKDLEQCKSKLKSMQRRYNREKMAKKFNPQECSSWEWYDKMNSLLIQNPHLISFSMDVKTTKPRISISDDVLSSRTLCDVNDKSTRKCIIEQNTSRNSLALDDNEKVSLIDKDGSLDSKFFEDEKLIQYSNLSTPTTPKSPRSFMTVKWSDSTPPQLSITDKFNKDQNNSPNVKPLDSLDGRKKILLVNEIKRNPLNCEERISNNITTIDRKGKGTLRSFDSCSNNSTNCFGSDNTDRDSATSSPMVLKPSQIKCMPLKHEGVGSSDKDREGQHVNRFSVMELSRSINCNYKRNLIENTTNINLGNEKKEVLEEIKPKTNESKSHTTPKKRKKDHNLATGVARNDEQMIASTAHDDLEAHSTTETFSKGSSLASLISLSESNFSSKPKKRILLSSKYKGEQGNRSSKTLMRALLRTAHNIPQFKKQVRLLNRASLLCEPNMITALMTFGAMIQQLEENHIVLIERILNQQSNILKDFAKTLKYNHQVREATMAGLVVRFFLSIFLIGVILFGTLKTSSIWMPTGFQASSWYGKNIDENFSQLAWIGCVIIVLFTQILWTSFKQRPISPSHS